MIPVAGNGPSAVAANPRKSLSNGSVGGHPAGWLGGKQARFGQRSIQIGSSIGQTADLVQPGNPDKVFVSGPCRVDGGHQQCRLVILADCQPVAIRAGNAASPQKMKATFIADPVADSMKNMVFQSPGGHQMANHPDSTLWPVGGQSYQIGTQ